MPAAAPSPSPTSRRLWQMLLLLPVAGLCFPGLYARMNPELFGIPFFYWYQLGWVLLSAAIMGLAYRKLSIPPVAGEKL